MYDTIENIWEIYLTTISSNKRENNISANISITNDFIFKNLANFRDIFSKEKKMHCLANEFVITKGITKGEEITPA